MKKWGGGNNTAAEMAKLDAWGLRGEGKGVESVAVGETATKPHTKADWREQPKCREGRKAKVGRRKHQRENIPQKKARGGMCRAAWNAAE